MQGSIFTAFADMVIETHGMGFWNKLLARVNPVSNGTYTKGQQYEDAELMSLVAVLSDETGQPGDQLVKHFGHYLFKVLYDSSPTNLSKISSLREFLLAIDGVIHREVKRLNPDSYLPVFEYEAGENDDLIMYYHSRRMLCAAAEGLIHGAAEQFNQIIEFSHPQCMHHGAAKCQFVIKFKDEG